MKEPTSRRFVVLWTSAVIAAVALVFLFQRQQPERPVQTDSRTNSETTAREAIEQGLNQTDEPPLTSET